MAFPLLEICNDGDDDPSGRKVVPVGNLFPGLGDRLYRYPGIDRDHPLFGKREGFLQGLSRKPGPGDEYGDLLPDKEVKGIIQPALGIPVPRSNIVDDIDNGPDPDHVCRKHCRKRGVRSWVSPVIDMQNIDRPLLHPLPKIPVQDDGIDKDEEIFQEREVQDDLEHLPENDRLVPVCLCVPVIDIIQFDP